MQENDFWTIQEDDLCDFVLLQPKTLQLPKSFILKFINQIYYTNQHYKGINFLSTFKEYSCLMFFSRRELMI